MDQKIFLHKLLRISDEPKVAVIFELVNDGPSHEASARVLRDFIMNLPAPTVRYLLSFLSEEFPHSFAEFSSSKARR